MNSRKFIKILAAVMIAGVVLTAAHLIYICIAYQDSSIIQFIARELWL